MTQSPAELPSLLERTVADVCFLNLHLHQSGMCSSLATPPGLAYGAAGTAARITRPGFADLVRRLTSCVAERVSPLVVCQGS